MTWWSTSSWFLWSDCWLRTPWTSGINTLRRASWPHSVMSLLLNVQLVWTVLWADWWNGCGITVFFHECRLLHGGLCGDGIRTGLSAGFATWLTTLWFYLTDQRGWRDSWTTRLVITRPSSSPWKHWYIQELGRLTESQGSLKTYLY